MFRLASAAFCLALVFANTSARAQQPGQRTPELELDLELTLEPGLEPDSGSGSGSGSGSDSDSGSDSEPGSDSEGEKPKAWEGTWSLYGASLATHQENGVSSYAVGVELSDVHIASNQLWYGYFADLRYSDLARGVDLTLGAEAGASVVGVDAGLYVRLGRNPAVGVRARGCVSALVVISICAGGGYTNRGAFFEGSVLLKYGRRRARPADSNPPRSDPPRSDPNADAEAGEQDEAAAVESEGAVDDEGVLVESAEFEEGVDPAESGGEPEAGSDPNDRAVTGDLGTVQVEAAADVLEPDPGADPELVEPAEVDTVDERNVDPEPSSARPLARHRAAGERDAE